MSQFNQPGRMTETRQFPTKSYLRQENRTAIISLLNTTLADTTTLQTHAKFAHWNVRGMEFYALHQLFEDVAETLEHHADMIAERITALGGQAMGTAAMATESTRIPRMPTDAVTGREYVEILSDQLAMHDAALFQAIETAQQNGDPDTADLLNEVSRDVSQHLWFLEAHFQVQPTETPEMPGAQQTLNQAPSGNSQSLQSPQQF